MTVSPMWKPASRIVSRLAWDDGTYRTLDMEPPTRMSNLDAKQYCPPPFLAHLRAGASDIYNYEESNGTYRAGEEQCSHEGDGSICP